MLSEGAFVRALFPTNEQPRRPGPLHICYCIAIARPMALVAYTSSRPWPAALPLPLGVRVFRDAEAATLNQRPFVLYLNRLAKLPITAVWFPDIALAQQGVIAMASPALREELLATLGDLVRRHREIIQQMGP